MNIQNILSQLLESGNFRTIPKHQTGAVLDLSSNDYLGLAQDAELRRQLIEVASSGTVPLSASASRLLAPYQDEHERLEDFLGNLLPEHRALLFNSGYHANTGIISALADRDTLILADRLVHASIIDGITLSRATLKRWRHNDLEHLQQLLEENYDKHPNILIITESIFSMDGDQAPIDALIDIKKRHPKAWLYIDEAHAFGVLGPSGLGLVSASKEPESVDIVVGTFGKALGSVGAFAWVSDEMRDFLVNKARSFIFSTALPPVNMLWTRLLLGKMLTMDAERTHLLDLNYQLAKMLCKAAIEHGFKMPERGLRETPSHIQPLIIGDARRTVELSQKLMEYNVKVLPIRTPTVPPGTERLRFSLSAAINSLDPLQEALDAL